MIKDTIEQQLREWFTQMTNQYSWLRIKYEFNENRDVFMVSFAPTSKIELSDEFNLAALKFADDMNARFSNNAPLFTDEELLFKLSDNAEVIGGEKTFSTISPLRYSTAVSVKTHRSNYSWVSTQSCTTSPIKKNFKQSQSDSCFFVAA